MRDEAIIQAEFIELLDEIRDKLKSNSRAYEMAYRLMWKTCPAASRAAALKQQQMGGDSHGS